jgi:hypothetical protein
MLTSRILATALGGAAALGTATAVAEPGFIQMDRQDQSSTFGVEAAYLVVDDVTAFRFDLHGQYVMNGGFGFYGAFPLAVADGDGDTGFGIGNVELGGIFLPRMTNPSFQLVLHGGVTLPTATTADDLDDLPDLAANLIGAEARMTDLVQVIPRGVTLRLGASPIFRSGQLFGRIDGGLDLNLDNDGDDNADPLIRINLGGGYDFGAGALVAEMINVISTDSDAANQVLNAFSVGFRASTGSLRPYAGLTFPLDGDDFTSDFAITGGLESAIGAQ